VNTFIPLAVRNGKSDWRASTGKAILSDLDVNQKVGGSNPNRGAKLFKHLQSPIFPKTHSICTSVGTFVGMLFHNVAQCASVILKVWRATPEETRAWVNFEVIEVLHQKEEWEWASFARTRQRSEKPSEPPADMLAHAKSGVRKSQRRK
jgi:hypothetical protein